VTRRTRLGSALAVAALAATLGACGAGGDGSGGGGGGSAPTTSAAAIPTVAKDAALAAMVPASVTSDGKLVFGVDASYPPNEFVDTDGTTIVGMDVDMGTAIAQKFGLTPEFQNSAFPGIIPGIQGGKYEMALSSFTINDERVQLVDMISYFSAGTSLATKKGNPDGLSIDDLCGKAIGVQAGTVQVDDIATRSKACTDAGKPAIQSTELQQPTDVTLALTSNRIVGILADSPVIAYAVKTTGDQLQVVGSAYDTAPYGVVVNKNQGQYPQAVQQAVQALIADGTYQQILKTYGVEADAITKATVNPDPSTAGQ